ncbi:MAG: hypothetical protein WBO92_00650 [Candidatus Moraniibacteriota bacterium]
MKQIQGIFSRTTGWSKWEIKPKEPIKNQRVIFPSHKEIVAIADIVFGPGARCSVHKHSEKGHWKNTIILDIPTGTSQQERRLYVEKLGPLTAVRPE